jgi:hypothetical protein
MENITPQYIAGFFDGEGSIGIYGRNKRPNEGTCLKTQLTQGKTKDSTKLLEFLRGKYGGSIGEQPTSSGRVKYNWQLSSRCARAFLTDILPYLVLKHIQARLALYWSESRPKMKRDGHTGRTIKFTEPELEFTRKATRLMKALKLDDIDTVLANQPDLAGIYEGIIK